MLLQLFWVRGSMGAGLQPIRASVFFLSASGLSLSGPVQLEPLWSPSVDTHNTRKCILSPCSRIQTQSTYSRPSNSCVSITSVLKFKKRYHIPLPTPQPHHIHPDPTPPTLLGTLRKGGLRGKKKQHCSNLGEKHLDTCVCMPSGLH